MIQRLDIRPSEKLSDLCISVNPNIDLSSIQPVAVHGLADPLGSFRTVEANHSAALGLSVFHLDVSILNHA